jgi:hypothetical protein
MQEKLEKEIEQKCIDAIQIQTECLILKEFERHYPDRLILLPGGRAVFIEFKRKNKNLRLGQNFVKTRLIKLGFEVYVIDDESQFADLLAKF